MTQPTQPIVPGGCYPQPGGLGMPGYYPDPAGGPTPRWFSGTTWTDRYAPPPEPARFTIHYGFALLAVFSLIGTLIIGIPLLSTAGDPQSHGAGAVMGLFWMLWGGMWTVIWIAFAINHTLKAKRGQR
jgi:hypothetical protein